jgi:hypothetical protein
MLREQELLGSGCRALDRETLMGQGHLGAKFFCAAFFQKSGFLA